ncbi:hypothetical protein LOK74_07250 [Brevibacillus humidisoli]|uniref:hypothetical protein n=1 Tax=Brevibacillus humidisoli TaxID=2895522 RepID=UPI001E3AD406|nr:hypothetical protein [Brevibacillus humidisoli]UFJ42280.1 hypothetical protein LOK74_07250 [Brevibacillus humidisoli]
MYQYAYRQLFWGSLIVLLDVRLQHFDILPDFVGYLIVIASLRKLSSQSSRFRNAVPFAVVNLPFFLFAVVELQAGLEEFPQSTSDLLWMWGGQAFVMLDLFMVYFICSGIALAARNQGHRRLARTVDSRWKFYLICQLLILIGSPLYPHIPFQWRIIYVALFAASLAAGISLLFLYRESARTFGRY